MKESRKFEDKLKELENITGRIKSGELPLDDTVRFFEQGMKIASELEQEINAAERKVEILVSGTEDRFKDFEEE